LIYDSLYALTWRNPEGDVKEAWRKHGGGIEGRGMNEEGRVKDD
jgi:hypothetical protein